MTTTLPKGVQSARSVTGNDSPFIYAPIASAYASNIGDGDPVKIASGVVALAAAGDAVVGIFRGVEYIDATTKKYTIRKNFVAGTTTGGTVNGESRPLAKIEPVEGKRFVVKTSATTTLANTSTGTYYPLTAVGTVDAYGNSTCTIDGTASVAVGAAHVQIVGLYGEEGNAWSATPVAVEVVFPTKALI